MSRVVITTWGSLGDLHPYLAIALELQRRGHEAVVATSPCYREKVESLGLRFQSVRPDCDWLLDGDKVRWFSHPRRGLLRVGRDAAIIHHGGVGTTGQAMRSGRPMLVVPHAWDQPDNAQRVVQLGIARALPKHRYTPGRAAAEVKQLLDNAMYSERASWVGEQVRRECGVNAACDALENVLQKKRPP